MDNQERAYSPAKAPASSDHYSRGFYGALTDQQAYHDTTHGTLPVQVGGYQISSTSRQSHQIPVGSVPLQSGGFHHQMPSQVGPLHPQPTVGLLRPSAQPMPLTVATQQTGLHSQPVTMSQNVPQTMVSQAHIAQMYPWMQPGGGNALSTDSQMSQSMQQQQQFQRLKVEDALSYLDQVKLQFSGHPQVYNDFLDIMKEFKSQAIDTPGVIKRVSCLFRGHPDLIVGFNTFLPPGYKIAVEANETISVEQPGQQAMSLSMFTTNLPSQVPVKPAHHNPPLPEPLTVPQPTQHGMTPGSQSASSGSATTGPPVEFNHAIQYVNKIKVCYQNQPEIYKSFLDILHKYQNEQKMLKEGTAFPAGYRPLTEVEVYALVTDLFKDQPQLLAEFSQFLPDASGTAAESALARFRSDCAAGPVTSKPPSASKAMRSAHQARVQPPTTGGRSTSQPPVKRAKMSAKEIAFPDSEKPGDLTFFDKMRDDLGERDYSDLLRCIELYTKQMTSPSELLMMVEPLINKMPELRARLLEFLRQRDENVGFVDSMTYPKQDLLDKSALKATYMVDLSTCKGEAVSYRLLPKSYSHPVCSGRSELCDEVLNDAYALHPSWPDDITSLGPHRKNQYEEHIYQCEDERYELDMVLELNNMAKMALMSIMARLKNFTCPDDVARFRLDDTLGGGSEVLMHTALNRLYGDKTKGIIEGLKCNPAAAVPIVLRRLVAKEKEWRTAQHAFNRIWREQNERYYLKSLDHQAAKFKQNDVKQIRSKTLMKEIEAEMQESPKGDNPNSAAGLGINICRDASILSDAASLILHHVRRQSALQPDDKVRIHTVLFRLMPSLLRLSMPLPPDLEKERDEEETAKAGTDGTVALENGGDHLTNSTESVDSGKLVTEHEKVGQSGVDESDTSASNPLFYGNDNWYYFLRLYMMLCERLKYFSEVAARLIEDELHYRSLRSTAVSAALKLRNPNAVDVCDSYSYFLELIRSLLEGNVEMSSFEDQLRDMFGIHAYVAFTIDKLLQNISRQLQYIATKDICWQLVTLYTEKYKKHGDDDDATMTSYQKEAEQIISDDKCFQFCMNIEKTEMTIEYIELSNSSSSDEQEQPVAEPASACEVKVNGVEQSHPRKATFVMRNLRRAHAVRRKQTPDIDDARTDASVLPPCVQLLNVESGGACLYTCGALTNAKQVCSIIHINNNNNIHYPRQCLWCCHHGRAIARVHPVHLMNVERCQAAADPRPSQTVSPPEQAARIYTHHCHLLLLLSPHYELIARFVNIV